MKAIKSLTLAVLTLLASSAAFAGGGNTSFGYEQAPFTQFACVSGNTITAVSLPDVLPPDGAEVSVNGSLFIHGTDANNACWTTLVGGYNSAIAGLNSEETVYLAGHSSAECVNAGQYLRTLFPINSKIKWIGEETLAIQANLSTQGVCSDSKAKIFAIFKF